MTGQLFVVEQYDDTGTPGLRPPLNTPPADVRLVCAVHVPVDDAVLALVEGVDEQTVRAALTDVGWRVDRINPATWLTSTAWAAVGRGHTDLGIGADRAVLG